MNGFKSVGRRRGGILSPRPDDRSVFSANLRFRKLKKQTCSVSRVNLRRRLMCHSPPPFIFVYVCPD